MRQGESTIPRDCQSASRTCELYWPARESVDSRLAQVERKDIQLAGLNSISVPSMAISIFGEVNESAVQTRKSACYARYARVKIERNCKVMRDGIAHQDCSDVIPPVTLV